jgi:hypothetical protein
MASSSPASGSAGPSNADLAQSPAQTRGQRRRRRSRQIEALAGAQKDDASSTAARPAVTQPNRARCANEDAPTPTTGSLPRSRPGLRSPSKPGAGRLGFLPAQSGGPLPRSPDAAPRAAGSVEAIPHSTTARSCLQEQATTSTMRGSASRSGPHHGSDGSPSTYARVREAQHRPETPRSARPPIDEDSAAARADGVKGAKRRAKRGNP